VCDNYQFSVLSPLLTEKKKKSEKGFPKEVTFGVSLVPRVEGLLVREGTCVLGYYPFINLARF